MRFLVVLNPSSGTAATATDDLHAILRTGFEAAGVDTEIISDKPPRLMDLAGHARENGFDAVIVGGGDGTLNAIANAVAGQQIPLGVLPLGTHNHFAKELGVPLELGPAVAALAKGRHEDMDVAEVNGHVFLNFSAIGLHPATVLEREARGQIVKDAGRFGKVVRKIVKVLSGLAAFVRTLARVPVLAIKLSGGNTVRRRLASSVIVCTNVHQMEAFGALNISLPNREKLNVYVAKATGPFGLVRLIGRAIFRQLHSAAPRDFECFSVSVLRIELRRRRLHVSIDGEVVMLAAPLVYNIRRGGLRVIVP